MRQHSVLWWSDSSLLSFFFPSPNVLYMGLHTSSSQKKQCSSTMLALWLLLVATSPSTDASKFLNDQVQGRLQDTTDGKLLDVVSDEYSNPKVDHDAQVVNADTADNTLLIHELFTNGTCSLCKCFGLLFLPCVDRLKKCYLLPLFPLPHTSFSSVFFHSFSSPFFLVLSILPIRPPPFGSFHKIIHKNIHTHRQ